LGAGGGGSVDPYEGSPFFYLPSHVQGELAYHLTGRSALGLTYRYQQNRKGGLFENQARSRLAYYGLRYANDFVITGQYTRLQAAIIAAYGQENVFWVGQAGTNPWLDPTGTDQLDLLQIGLESCIKAQFTSLILKLGGGIRYDWLLAGEREIIDLTFPVSPVFPVVYVGNGRLSADFFFSIGLRLGRR